MSTQPTDIVVLVTGSSSGFGFHLVKFLLKAGYKVIAASRSASPTQPALGELKAAGAALLALDPGAPYAVIKETLEQTALNIYGHIDVVINNAGYLIEGPMEEFTYVYYLFYKLAQGLDGYYV